jgi:hypothetical protein
MALMNDECRRLTIVSFNMHGFNQGFAAVNELIENYHPNVFFTAGTLAHTCQLMQV